MITYQDYENRQQSVPEFVAWAIMQHKASEEYRTACIADQYDRQRNVTINSYVQTIWNSSGIKVEDFTATNNKIASNFFHRLNKQRCVYLLGNGVTFAEDKNGKLKESMGQDFDARLRTCGYYALIHGLCFGFWNYDQMHVFKLTEFAPLWDEFDGTLKAGIRFWQVADNKPVVAVLYELDGYTKFTSSNGWSDFVQIEPKHGYKTTIAYTEAGGQEVVGEENYSALPIVPLWGSELHQSTLVGMQHAIDSYDLIRSGFANDLSDCSQIYWIVENCAGMTDDDLQRFRDKLKIQRIVEVGTGDDGARVTPYTQEIPYAARQAYLNDVRHGIYEDFGALDVTEISASAKTATEINAAYQPMDEEADDFEYQVIDFVQQILRIKGDGDNTPEFKRNRVSNQREQVDMVLAEAEYLDEQTVLEKLPNITPDEVQKILEAKLAEDARRFVNEPQEEPEE